MLKTNNLLHIALITALNVALSLLIIIPVPAMNGFVTMAEVGIYTAAYLLGPSGGFWVGALSGGLIDFFSGYPQWIIFSIVIHGLQGLITGYVFRKIGRGHIIIGLSLGSLTMIVGYGLATLILYTWPAALASIPGNLVQNLFGGILTFLLIQYFRKNHLQLGNRKE